MSSFGLSASYPAIADKGKVVKHIRDASGGEETDEGDQSETESDSDREWLPGTSGSESSSDEDAGSSSDDRNSGERDDPIDGEEPPVSPLERQRVSCG